MRKAEVGSGDAALRVQHAFEDRGVRLGEARGDHGEERLVVARGLRRPSRRGAHSIIATQRAVQTWADAMIPPAPPTQRQREVELVVAAQERRTSGGASARTRQ